MAITFTPQAPRRTLPRSVVGQWLSTRRAAQALGMAGLVAYNWWVFVPLEPGLLRSPDELFSDLEVPGHPFAAAMAHADLVSGILLLSAFALCSGISFARRRGEWSAMVVFALAGIVGALYPEACADGVSAVCRRLEWTLQLPLRHYVHIVAGIFEFGAVTLALVLAYRRTRGERSRASVVYRIVGKAALPAYLLLGAAYLFNIWGGVMEAVFFAGFTTVVLLQLFERPGVPHSDPGATSDGHTPRVTPTPAGMGPHPATTEVLG